MTQPQCRILEVSEEGEGKGGREGGREGGRKRGREGGGGRELRREEKHVYTCTCIRCCIILQTSPKTTAKISKVSHSLSLPPSLLLTAVIVKRKASCTRL